MTQITIEVEGLPDLLKNLDPKKVDRAMRVGMDGAMKIVRHDLNYPPATEANQPKTFHPGGNNRWYQRGWGTKWARKDGSIGGRMTSEELAQGDATVARWFADQLVKYAELAPKMGWDFPVARIGLGRDLALVFLPGEPFTEIGLAIKKASAFRQTFVASHGNGYCGYVALPDCFARGGYEVLPVVGGGPRQDGADILIAAGSRLVQEP